MNTQDALAQKHVSIQGTLALEHVSMQGTLACEHVSTCPHKTLTREYRFSMQGTKLSIPSHQHVLYVCVRSFVPRDLET